MKKALFVASLAALFLAACSQGDVQSSGKAGESAGKGQQKPLVIGLTPEHQIFAQMERYEPLADYLSKKIGRRVKLMILPEYGNIIDNFVSTGMDGAFFGSFAYVLAHERLGVRILARPECKDGISTYHGLIFVRKDSGIGTSRDMKGKTLALVDRATTAGYLLPLEYFKRAGIRDYKTYFGETYFTGTHEDAVLDVLNRRADVGAAKNTVFSRAAADDKRVKDELLVLDRSPDVPENGLAVRRDLDPAVRDKLKEVLLTMHNDKAGKEGLEKLGAARFIETTDRDYEPVVRLAREAGVDLATYRYTNE